MNKRIRELALQANANELSYAYYRGEKKPENAVTLHSIDLEKFAELIVRECVRYFNEDYQRDFDTLWREDLTKGIKEHFGVRE
jgi:hypothetical protein